jgi:hypothetical protein
MAFADPQSVDVTSAGATDLSRNFGSIAGIGTFSSADGSITESITQPGPSSKRNRRTIRINVNKLAPDVLNPSLNTKVSASVYLVVDAPVVGFSTAELQTLVTGFNSYLAASSAIVVTALLRGEN